MDEEPVCGKMCLMLKACRSDRESFNQERPCQHADHHQRKKADRNEDANEDEAEDFQLYDSLEVTTHYQDGKNPNPFRTKYLDAKTDDGGRISQLLPEDAYSDLRYDPSWKTKLKGAGQFGKGPQISTEEHHQNPKDGKGQVLQGGYRYVGDTSPMLDHVHLQNGQISSLASPCCTNFTLQPRPPEGELTRPSGTQNESSQTLQRGKDAESCGEHTSTNKSQAVHLQDFQNCYQQDLRHTTRGGTVQSQKKVLSKKKTGSVAKNIVESNKITLGRNTCKVGSYTRALTLLQGTSHEGKKVNRSLGETVSSQSPEEGSSSRQTVQKTHQVGQISNGKKVHQKEDLSLSPQQQPPPPGVKAAHGGGRSSPSANPTPVIHPGRQEMPSSRPPAVHLNIFLSSPSDLLPVLQQTGPDAVISFASLHSHTHWGSPPDVASSSARQTCPGTSQEGLRMPASKSSLTCEPEGQRCPCETQMKEFVQNLPDTPTTLSQASSPYPVLPPIGKVVTEEASELCRGESANATRPALRGNSNSYLLQMEKQKHMRARSTYKAYTLKDYKQLELDVKLQGLGPDYTVKETAKMKRQRLYSNVIREQNKKISRIPFPLTKDPEGNDKKVPRMKALEYAKTIAKPLASHSQTKQRQKDLPQGFEHTPYVDGVGASELAALELLRKRHLEERQAVALLRKVYAV